MQREANLIISVRQALWNEYLIVRLDFDTAESRPWKAAYLSTPKPFSGSDQALATRNVASFASNASGMHNKRSGFIVGIGVGLSGRVGLAVGIGVGSAVGFGVGSAVGFGVGGVGLGVGLGADTMTRIYPPVWATVALKQKGTHSKSPILIL